MTTGKLTLGIVFVFLAAGLVGQVRAVAPIYPPLVNSSDGVTITDGVSVDIVRAVAMRAKVTIVFESQPFARALSTAMNTDGVLVFPVIRTPERSERLEWIGPVNRVDYYLYANAGGPSPKVKSLDEVDGRSIGVLTGDIVDGFLTEHKIGRLTRVSNLESLVKMLYAGRIDYLVATPQALESSAKGSAIPLSGIKPALRIEAFGENLHSYLAIAKGSNPQLVKALRDAFDSILQDGTWDSIYSRYSNIRSPGRN